MTKLERKVVRAVPAPRRDLVVSLEWSGGESLLTVREKGRRQGYAITVPSLFMILARRDADNRIAAKRAAKRK